MSDGGAQVIVAAGQGVVQLARFSVGRVLLWFIAAWLTLSAITARSERGLLFFVAIVLAAIALIGHFIAERRRRAERAALRSTLMLLGVVLVSLVGGLWLAFRRKGASPVAALARARGSNAAELAAEVQRQLVLSDEAAEKPATFSDRVAQFLTLHSRRVLALSVVAHVARAKSAEEAAAEVEKLGLAKLEHLAVGQLEDLFSLKLTLLTGAALLICLAPQVVFWFTR